MKKVVLISLVIFIIVSVLIIAYTIEISSTFTEFEGEDEDFEDGSVEKTSKIIQQVRYKEFVDNLDPQLEFSYSPITYFSIIKSIIK